MTTYRPGDLMPAAPEDHGAIRVVPDGDAEYPVYRRPSEPDPEPEDEPE